MKMMNLLSLIACAAIFVGRAEVSPSSGSATASTKDRVLRFLESDASGSTTIEWEMPREGAVLLAQVAREMVDEPLKSRLEAFLKEQSEPIVSEAGRDIGKEQFRPAEGSKADFILDRRFSGLRDNQRLYIKMPAHKALVLLKAAFIVGDAQLKSQIMSFGFSRYENEEVKSDILNFLSGHFDRFDRWTQFEVVGFMFFFSPYSPQTKTIISKTMKLDGDDKATRRLRKIAIDFDTYLRTGDETILEKYTIICP